MGLKSIKNSNYNYNLNKLSASGSKPGILYTRYIIIWYIIVLQYIIWGSTSSYYQEYSHQCIIYQHFELNLIVFGVKTYAILKTILVF